MQKKNLHLKRALLVLIICLMGLAKAMAQSFTVGDLNYSVNSDGTTVTVTGHVNGTAATGSLVIPESVTYESTAYDVTSIGSEAFYNCSGFTGILTIPSLISSIGNDAFEDCSGFTEVHYNAINCSGGYGWYSFPFRRCGGTLTIGENVERIPYRLFKGANFTGNVSIPTSIISFGLEAFSNCNGLTGVQYSGTLSQWCNIDFTFQELYDGASNPLYSAHNLYINNQLVTELIIPETITQINDGIFTGATCLSSLTLPNNGITIGSYAFNYSGLSGDLIIPETVALIGDHAFSNCTNISTVYYLATNCGDASASPFSDCSGTLIIGENVQRIPNNMFTGSDFSGTLTIPNSVTSIGISAFAGCSEFSEVHYNATRCGYVMNNYYTPFKNCSGTLTIGENVEIIPSYMFSEAAFTGILTIPNSVTEIGRSAFSSCSGLTGNLIIPSSVTSIEYGTFRNCSGFTGHVSIPSSITSLDHYAFYGCSGLTEVQYSGTLSQWCSINFQEYLEAGFQVVYCSNPLYYIHNLYINNELVTELIIPETLTQINSGAFAGATCLTSLTLPSTCISIGKCAFYECSGLTTMTVLAALPPHLDYGSFSNVPKDIPVYIPSGTTEEYQTASGWCEFTNYIELGETLTFHTYVDEDVYAMNTSIPIHGSVVNGENIPMANMNVEIGVFVMGMKRSLRTTTNEDGQFSATFEPMPSESGYYTVNSGRVGNHSTAVHDDFNIPGMVVMADGYVLCPVTQNQPKTDSIRIRNKCNLELNDIQVSVLSAPEGCSISFMPLSLSGLETDYLVYTVNGTELTQGNYYQEIQLKATSSIGAETNFSIWYYCMEPRGILNVAPNNIATTMTKGQSKIVDVMLSNHGTAATGEITIDLPEVEWMSVVGSNILPSLAVNDSAYFSLRLAPGNDIPLTQYSGNITINCEHGEYVDLPFNIIAVSESTGNLVVDVTDEYTWNTNGGLGPHLANAEVTLTGYFSLETVAHGYTNENGVFNVEQLPEGYYRLHVEADHHEEYNNVILIDAGTTSEQDIFISYQAVTYDWTMVPGEVQDEYEFVLNTTYETNVPFPDVTIDAPVSIPEFEESYTFNYIITNHGLINTYNIRLHVPEDEDFLFTPNYENVDTLSGLTTIEIPCMVTHLTNNTHICKRWVESWIEYQYDCGPYIVTKYAHDYTLLGTESCGGTPPTGGHGGYAGGGGGAPGFGGWWWGGGSGHSSLYIYNIPVITPSGSICVQVGVQFNQQMVMTREAFFGTFSVHNGFDTNALEAIGLNFVVTDEDNNNCTDLFQITTNALTNLTNIDGSGSLDAGLDGMAQILFIPTKEAAPTEPKVYRFGGTFTFVDPYTSDTIVCNLYPVPLTVHPSPDLYVDYFMQRDIIGDDALTLDVVEPSVPAELGVIINNKGTGIAKNVILETAEPEIVENSQGLIIDFSMYGASFNGNEAQLGLMEIPFGNIESGHTAVGEWLFTSSLLGHFVSYDAHVIHNNSYDNPNLSLVSHLDIHELIHPIRAYGNLEDGINDFLVNDVPDDHNYPDSIYFSNGGRTGVSIANNISFDHYVTPQDTIVTLTVRPSKTGWNYGVVNDPGSEYVLVGCKRIIDNQIIPMNNVWQTFVTLCDGEEPIYENKLHFVDTLSNGRQDYTYTLIYSLNEPTAPCQINIEDELCEGDDYTMNGFNLTDLSAGTYDETLYVHNAFGYDNIISLHLVVLESPEVHIQIDTIYGNGISFRLTATGAEHYEWSTGETTASILVSPVEATTYSVVGTNANGCSDSAEVTVSSQIGIEENSQPSPTKLYPNPTHDKLFVKTSQPITLLEIYTISGILMYKQTHCNGETEISLNEFASGIYVIRIVSETTTETKRFIVE